MLVLWLILNKHYSLWWTSFDILKGFLNHSWCACSFFSSNKSLYLQLVRIHTLDVIELSSIGKDGWLTKILWIGIFSAWHFKLMNDLRVFNSMYIITILILGIISRDVSII